MRRAPPLQGRVSLLSNALAGALGIALLSSSAAMAQQKLAARLDFIPYGSHAPFYLAQEKGWFKENGVEPTIEDGTGTTTTVQLVGAGKYDIGYAGFVSAMVAREKGVPVKAIAGVFRKGDLGVVVDEKGEASLRGHLKNDSAPEAKGSISYVPKEKEKDVQLKAAIDLLHGKKIETSKKLENAAAPAPTVNAEVPN